jgi:hypothetical protein
MERASFRPPGRSGKNSKFFKVKLERHSSCGSGRMSCRSSLLPDAGRCTPSVTMYRTHRSAAPSNGAKSCGTATPARMNRSTAWNPKGAASCRSISSPGGLPAEHRSELVHVNSGAVGEFFHAELSPLQQPGQHGAETGALRHARTLHRRGRQGVGHGRRSIHAAGAVSGREAATRRGCGRRVPLRPTVVVYVPTWTGPTRTTSRKRRLAATGTILLPGLVPGRGGGR